MSASPSASACSAQARRLSLQVSPRRRGRHVAAAAQVGGTDLRAGSDHRQAAAQVLQFAHVAGEVLPRQRAQRRGGEALGRDLQFARGAGQEMPRQQRDVVAALAQRRQGDAHHVQAVLEVGAEAAFADQRVQVLVGGGDDAHVAAQQFAPTDAVELALGQHAQQAGLQRCRHVADLVQEQRAALGLLEAAGVAAGGAGEGAGLVAEQFAFQQLGRDGGGVEGHERPFAARALGVQRARGQFLAGAGLAGDQHVEVAGGDAPDQAEHLAHGGAFAQQGVGRRRFGGGFVDGRVGQHARPTASTAWSRSNGLAR